MVGIILEPCALEVRIDLILVVFVVSVYYIIQANTSYFFKIFHIDFEMGREYEKLDNNIKKIVKLKPECKASNERT